MELRKRSRVEQSNILLLFLQIKSKAMQSEKNLNLLILVFTGNVIILQLEPTEDAQCFNMVAPRKEYIPRCTLQFPSSSTR